MATIDERVAHLEGQVESQFRGLDDLRDLVRQVDTRAGALDLKVDRRLAEIDEKFDRRCSDLEQKFDRRTSELEETFDRRLDVMDQRLLRLDDKIARQFVWVVGTQVAVLIAVVGALVGT